MSFCSWFTKEPYRDHFERGVYACSVCGNELFHSRSKFEHSSPWPSFTETIRDDSITRRPESATTIKISCGKCDNGLGHEFIGDGPKGGQSRF